MTRSGQAPNSLAWWLVCALPVAGSLAVWQLPVELQVALRWRAADWAHQPWTLWSAALTHINATHLALNALSLLLLGLLGARAGAGSREALALALAWPLTHAALLAWPSVVLYAGGSGLTHAAGGVIFAQGIVQSIASRRLNILAVGLGLAFVAKLLWECAWLAPIRLDARWGFNVVQAAHLSGFVAGWLAGLLTRAAWPLQRTPRRN